MNQSDYFDYESDLILPSWNSTIFLFQPEEDGSFFKACTSITRKSDIQILYNWKWIVQGLLSSVVIGFGFIGNLGAVIILSRPNIITAFNQLLIALCFFDSIFLVSCIASSVEAYGFEVIGWLSSCLDVMAHVSMCGSVFMMVALTFERHFAICSPHAYRIHLRITSRWKHLSMYLLPVTLLAFFVNIPMFINLQSHWMEDAIYVKINLYLRFIHPLTTTGLAPVIILLLLNIRIRQGINFLHQRRHIMMQRPTTLGTTRRKSKILKSKRRHTKEISATYTSIAIVASFVILNLPRIVASTHEVTNTSLIITCIEAGRKYIPSMNFYKLDSIARLMMITNSSINFLIYCAVSSSFQDTLRDKFFLWLPSCNRPTVDASFHFQEEAIKMVVVKNGSQNIIDQHRTLSFRRKSLNTNV